MSKDKSIYELYAIETNKTNLELLEKEKYIRVTPNYSLLYVKKCDIKGSVKLTDKDLSRLTKQDIQWLYECMAEIVKEDLIENERENAKKLNESLDKLEDELKKQKKEFENEQRKQTSNN